ncbi:MAG: aldehyde ferredoxin oxidoreductase C-terminal domain-containing protein [Candidatus Methylomirabilales bacterium]
MPQDAETAKGERLYKWGTGGVFSPYALGGIPPVRNSSTNVFHERERRSAEYIRGHCEHRNKPGWACGRVHMKHMKVAEGPCTGDESEEPEYESMAAWSPVIGNMEPGAGLPAAPTTGHRLPPDTWVVARPILSGLHHEYGLERLAA